ncbi:MAG: hypothetical protein FWF29_11905, partial [Treponema sp.]|nr:hypothetical protein [Treponema sp.]
WDPSNDVLKALFSVAGLEGKRKSFVISKKDVGDALALHTAKSVATSCGLLSAGKRAILSALGRVRSLVDRANSWLKGNYSNVVFSEGEAFAYISKSGVVEQIEIIYQVYGAGIKPYSRVWVLSKGVSVWR